MQPRNLKRCIRTVVLAAISCFTALSATNAPVKAAGKDSVTVSVVLALAAGEWSTEILAGANAAAKDLNGKVKVRVSGPTTFDPQRQAQMFLAELETKPDVLIVVNVAPPLFTQPALEAQSRGAHVVWISVPPMPEVKDPFFVGSDAFGMGQTAGSIIVAALEKSLNKPAQEISGDVVTGICVPGLVVLENRLGGEISYLEKEDAEDQRPAGLQFRVGSRTQLRVMGSSDTQDAKGPHLSRSLRRGRGEYPEDPRKRQNRGSADIL